MKRSSDDILRGYKQRAAFASVDFDIVPKTLTLTVGTRYYRFDNMEVGSAVSTFGCYPGRTAACTNGALNLNDENLRTTYTACAAGGISPGRSRRTFSPITPGRRGSGPAIQSKLSLLLGAELRVPLASPRHAHEQRARVEDAVCSTGGCSSMARSTRRTGRTCRPCFSIRTAASATWHSRPTAQVIVCEVSRRRSLRV